MAANSTARQCLLLAILATSISAFANTEVVEALTLDAGIKLAELEQRASECGDKKQRRQLPPFDIEELKSLHISRKDALTALTYLSGRNMYQCEHNEKLSAAFALGTLASAKREYQIDDTDIQDVLTHTIYPSVKHLEISITYARLPEHIKNYFEHRVGNEPFNLLESLKSIPTY